MIVINLHQQQAQDADLKAKQKISFTENLKENATMFFILKEVKETILDFSQGIVRVLWLYFVLT